jgi:hypothetical protein
MMEPFVLKVITSFLVGGLFIAAQSILAERHPHVGGLIISVPSTLPIDLFFIGWSEDMEAAMKAASIVPIAIALLLLFSTVFIYSAQYGDGKIKSLLVANISSLVIWFILAFLVISFRFDNLGLELGVYIVVLFLTAYLLYYRQRRQSPKALTRTTVPTGMNIVLRALFGGLIICSSVILSKVLTPLWGGVFSVFPATYLSTFNIIHLNAGKKHLLAVGKTIPEGSVFFLIYVILAYFLFAFGILWGTVLAELITIVLIVILAKLRQLTWSQTDPGGIV